MTPIQILIPLTDVLFIIFAMIDIFRQVHMRRNNGIIACQNKFKLGQMSICFVGSSFCLFASCKACGWISLSQSKVQIAELNCVKSLLFYNDFRDNRIKTRKERNYSFPIREVLMHRLKVRMMPFKNEGKHVKIFMEKFMDMVAVFITPLSYVIFKDL